METAIKNLQAKYCNVYRHPFSIQRSYKDIQYAVQSANFQLTHTIIHLTCSRICISIDTEFFRVVSLTLGISHKIAKSSGATPKNIDEKIKSTKVCLYKLYKTKQDIIVRCAGYMCSLITEKLEYRCSVTGILFIHRWYPAKRALSAMRKHGWSGPFGRIPSTYAMTESIHWLTYWGRDKMAAIFFRRHFQMHFIEWK